MLAPIMPILMSFILVLRSLICHLAVRLTEIKFSTGNLLVEILRTEFHIKLHYYKQDLG